MHQEQWNTIRMVFTNDCMSVLQDVLHGIYANTDGLHAI